MNWLDKIAKLLGAGDYLGRYHAKPERTSKHMGVNFRHTKAYADDRQKSRANRRKHGMRKRK